MARLDAIWAELEAHKDELEEPKPDTRPQAERSAREQDNHHYYKIFADGVKTLLEAL